MRPWQSLANPRLCLRTLRWYFSAFSTEQLRHPEVHLHLEQTPGLPISEIFKWIPMVLPLVLFSDVWRKQSKAKPFWKQQALFIKKSLDSRNLIQLPNSWFPYKTLIKEARKQVHKGYPLYKPQNSNNKHAPGMAIMNSNGASPGFVFRCLEKAK